MRLERVTAYCALLALVALTAAAQEKPKVAEEAKPGASLSVQVVFSEYEGEKKLGSLPYTVSVLSESRPPTQLRVGLRVPVQVEGGKGFQYFDVGTDIDCSAHQAEEGRFMLSLSVRRSSIYSAGPDQKSIDWKPGDPPISLQPVVREFRAQFHLLMRDGQTAENTVATDPVSGRVLKVSVALKVLK